VGFAACVVLVMRDEHRSVMVVLNLCGDDVTVGYWRQVVSGLRCVRCVFDARWTLECNDCVLVWWTVCGDDVTAAGGEWASLSAVCS
jgi:hypothetical protein